MNTRCTALGVALAIAWVARAPAALLFTGDDSPCQVGFTLIGPTGMSAYSLDCPAVGLMSQHSPDDNWGVWQLGKALATEDLSSVKGWFLEVRVAVRRAQRTHWPHSAAVNVIVEDDTDRGAQLSVHPDRVVLTDARFEDFAGIRVDFPDDGAFHTARITRLPDAGDIVVSVDGQVRGQLAAYETDARGPTLNFGSAWGGGDAVWDYVGVNAAGAPTPPAAQAPAPDRVEVPDGLRVESAGGHAGNYARVWLNDRIIFGEDERPAHTGINVFAFGNGRTYLQDRFDTNRWPHESERFAYAIDLIPDGYLVVLVAKDDATERFEARGQQAIRSIGGAIGLLGQPWRCSYYCIGRKGARPGTAIEAVSADRPVAYPPRRGDDEAETNEDRCDGGGPASHE